LQVKDGAPRRGWRERIEAGLYRGHLVNCPRTTDRKPGGRCACPYELHVPGVAPGRFRSLAFRGTLAEARAERRRLLSEGRLAPDLVIGTANGQTLDDFTADYFRVKGHSLAANTIRNREDDYLRRIAPELGRLELTQLTRERVEIWLAGLVAAATSRRMIYQSVATLRVILATAVEWGRRTDNPAARLRLPAAASHAVPAERVLTRQQLAVIIAAAGTIRTGTLIRTAGEAGLRRGELVGLRWPDVDLEARRLHVRRQVVQERLVGGGHRKVETPTKGKRARRAAISEALATRLADWFAESVIEGGAPADGYVWPGRRGDGPMHDRSAHRALERTSQRAGLVDDQGRPLVSLHGLRHTAASIMLGAGVPLLVVSRQLGHASPQITATIYAHLASDDQLDAAARAFQTDGDSGGQGRPLRERGQNAAARP
jgi:integrase